MAAKSERYIASDRAVINYTASPTCVQFHASDALVRGIRGPIGSGKSTACCLEAFGRMMRQHPWPGTKRRVSRWAFIRNTFPELKTTTIRTWADWFGRWCQFRYDSPIEARFRMPLDDGTHIDAELIFLALDLPGDVKKLKSLELTGIWLNEASELDKSVLDMSGGRIRRYPSDEDGGYTWSGLIMDTNPPDDTHWWYRLAEEEQPEGWEFFVQPPAVLRGGTAEHPVYMLNPKAENVDHQPAKAAYWLDQVGGKTGEWIKVYLMGEYGTTSDGKPVYPEYRDDIHCVPAASAPYMAGSPLLIGWDFGLTPSAVFGQQDSRGQLRVIDELVSENMGIRQFARDVVKPHIANRYPGATIRCMADPAGTQRSQVDDEQTCISELRAAGFRVEPAPTNSFIARREAVASFMTAMRDGKPSFAVSDRCKVVRKGFIGGYHYERVQVSGEARYKDQPAKNSYSHPHDALQYLALMVAGTAISGRSTHRGAQVVHSAPIQPSGWT